MATDVATADVPASVPDERLAYRGPIQRLLVQPEIGALVGAIAIWVFFWAVTVPFGTAGGTANWLDVAATLGIMAVAVAMLMIGGEFDLSAGAMTGATAILVIMLVKDTGELGGAGLSLWIGIPLSLVLALGIGWFNGTLVERTGLPSFIVTLGAFFVIKGAKLGFAKLFFETIQVGRIDEGAGYDFWRKIFSAVWTRNDHIFNSRDIFYVGLLIIGGVAILVGLLELTYKRRTPFNLGGLPITGIGVAAGLVGLFALHATDGIAANFIWAAVMGAGVAIGAYGIALWRFEPNQDRGRLQLSSEVLRLAGIGTGLLALGVVLGLILDSAPKIEDREIVNIFFLLTEQGLRAILFVGLAIAGLVVLLIAASRAKKSSDTSGAALSLYTALGVTVLAFIIRSEAEAPKFRTELFSALLLIALVMATWAVVGLYFAQRRGPDPAADRLGRSLAIGGVLLATLGVVVRLLFTKDSELATLVGQTQFRISILWFIIAAAVATWILARTRFGSWTFAVGGSKSASRQVGVPAARTKTQLFMIVSGAAWLVGMLLAFRLNTIQASTGDGKEFEYIIAAVVGGTLLTGGYGTAAGAAIGALIMAMSQQGIPFAGWNSDWRFVFLGSILLLAVLANNYIRKTAEAAS